MPQTLYSFFQSEGVKKPAGGSNLAGFIDGGVFKYYASSNLLAPATVNALEAKAKTSKATVYTNREETLWIKHYPRIKVKFMDALKSTEADGSVMVTPVLQTVKKWPRQIAALDIAAPLPGGGLYAAAAGAQRISCSTKEAARKGWRGRCDTTCWRPIRWSISVRPKAIRA